MLFNSLEFAVFFALAFGVYCLLPHRAQNRWLLLASYLFYGAWDWRFLGLILVSTVVDYRVAIHMSRVEVPRVRKRLLALSVATNLGILGTFKYAGFFLDSLAQLAAKVGLTIPPFALQIVLPVGISFYTFQTLGYTIDVYRGRVRPTRDFLDFALFVAFFPQLVAGPIERAARLLPQIAKPRRVDLAGLTDGAWLVLWGLFKKVVIADNLQHLVTMVYAPGADPQSAEVWLATYAFAVQIYCDFSGYTDVARGIARMLGFELMLNFNLPYLAVSPADFWRRWHISLSNWLRDYLYIPLGGNRGGRLRTYRNLLLTMLLGGLWHGAAWTFVAWGAYHGLLLALHRAGRQVRRRLAPSAGLARLVGRLAAIVLTFHLVCLGWLLFRAESLPLAIDLLAALAGPWQTGLAGEWLLPFVALVTPLALMQAAQAASGDLEVVARCPVLIRALILAGLILAIIVFGEDFGQAFIYFQF
ncbi:MAG: MBOAT family protein [Acidobacteriota bacterium]